MDTEKKLEEEKKETKPEGNSSGGSNELSEKLNYLETEKKNLIKQRDELKEKLRKIDEADALKKGEYEKLISMNTAELEKVRAELNEAVQYKEKFESLDKSIRTEAISKLSDEHKKIAELLPTESLLEYVKINTRHVNGMDAGTNGRGTVDITGKKWTDFNSTELEQLKKDNAAGYMRLYRERFPKT